MPGDDHEAILAVHAGEVPTFDIRCSPRFRAAPARWPLFRVGRGLQSADAEINLGGGVTGAKGRSDEVGLCPLPLAQAASRDPQASRFAHCHRLWKAGATARNCRRHDTPLRGTMLG
jgi:hypothetical protein